MRSKVTKEKIERLFHFLGQQAKSKGRIYVVGGTSAVLFGWRLSTADIDLKLHPEAQGIFEALAKAKNLFDLNIELAAPDDFLPPLPGWEERSPWIGRFGPLEIFHYDFYAQALAKIERGHAQDRSDVEAMFAEELIDKEGLQLHLNAILPAIPRYPAIEQESLVQRVARLLPPTKVEKEEKD